MIVTTIIGLHLEDRMKISLKSLEIYFFLDVVWVFNLAVGHFTVGELAWHNEINIWFDTWIIKVGQKVLLFCIDVWLVFVKLVGEVSEWLTFEFVVDGAHRLNYGAFFTGLPITLFGNR